jgi:Asp-tRNA(Asn)/Glu-tRNA(Gln) amidotransferase C subunit
MDVLNQAKELADKILELTRALVLTRDKDSRDAEVEAYVALMDEREPLVEELSDLRLQLDETETASPEFSEITKVIAQITDLDKKHLTVMEDYHKTVQNSYKGVKQGQRIHAGYKPLPGNEVSSTFDIKQ